MAGGTASFVAPAVDSSGRRCVLKVAMPLDVDETDGFRRSVLVHRLAGGCGCARLYEVDDAVPAMLLEELGPNLHDLGMGVPAVLEAVAATLRSFWRPAADVEDLPTGA